MSFSEFLKGTLANNMCGGATGMTAGNESDSDGRRDRARKRRLNKENVHSPARSSFISSYMNALTEAQERGYHGLLNAASDESQRHE